MKGQDRSFAQRMTKRRDRIWWRVKDSHEAQHASVQPAPAGIGAVVHETLPACLETGTTHRSWCKLQGKSLLHGLPTPTMGALIISSGGESRARTSNKQSWEIGALRPRGWKKDF